MNILFSSFFCILISSTNSIYKIDCSCDLDNTNCDINCCCDTLCTEDDINTFYCNTQTKTNVNEVCTSSIYGYNFYGANINARKDDSKTCFWTNNYAENNFIVEPKFISESEFDLKAVNYFGYPKTSTDLPIPTSQYYKSGDQILSYFNISNLLGVFGIPKDSNVCYSSPIGFLYKSNITCTLDSNIYSSSALRNCQPNALPLLNSRNFKNFQIVKDPSSVTNTADGVYLDTSNLLNIECNIISNMSLNCNAQPTLINNNTCTNLVQKVSYYVEYDGTNGITNVVVNISLSNIQTILNQTLPFKQTYSVIFYQKGQPIYPVTTSGTPGYLLGYLVRVAIGNNNVCEYKEDAQLSILQPSALGLCSNPTRQPVVFGVDAYTQCIFMYNESNVLQNCNQTQSLILKSLLGNQIFNFVSTWGGLAATSDCTKQPWLPVAFNPQAFNTSQCENLLTGVEVKIIYSNTGLRSNAQPVIVAMQYNYITTPLPLQIVCSSSMCANTPTELLLSNSIQFIDQSNAGLRV